MSESVVQLDRMHIIIKVIDRLALLSIIVFPLFQDPLFNLFTYIRLIGEIINIECIHPFLIPIFWEALKIFYRCSKRKYLVIIYNFIFSLPEYLEERDGGRFKF